MNNKRQTIWLVSMLSLMVILSAYYLFTEDVTPAGQTAKQAEGYTLPGDGGTGVEITEVDGDNAQKTDTGTGASADSPQASEEPAQSEDPASGQPSAEADGANAESAPEGDSGKQDDEAVLQGLNNLSGREYIDRIALERMENYSKQQEELNAIIADTKNHTPEEAQEAMEKLSLLDATEERITSLEEKLLADYGNAVVEEEDNNFKVVVEADKLEKSQAVKIVELAMKELNVSPDRLTVQYIP